MYTQPPEPIVEALSALTSQIVALHARCDALSTLVQVLATNQGAQRKDVLAVLETVRATCLQKRLEQIEDQSPRWAARIDQRPEAGEVDPNLLKSLRFVS